MLMKLFEELLKRIIKIHITFSAAERRLYEICYHLETHHS